MNEPFAIPSATPGRRIWLRVGTLIDGSGSAPQRDAHVVYDARSIRFVGTNGFDPPRDLLTPGQERPDVDAPEATLLPGLIEAHAHLFLEGGETDPEKRAAALRRSPGEMLAAARERLSKLVALGIAGVRDAGDRHGVGLALSRLDRAGNRPLTPYVESPGSAIHRRGRYGSFMAEPIEAASSLRACVEARVRAGADRIKLIATGIIDFKKAAVTSAPQMSTAEIAELAGAARAFNRQTFAHASGDAGIERVIEGGVDSVEHGYFVRDDQLARMRDRNIAWVPTFAPVLAQIEHASIMGWDSATVDGLRRILERHAASLVKAHELGVRIVAGSDAGSYGVPHGVGLWTELECMARAGLSNLAVLHAATGAGAGRFNYRERFGLIAPAVRSRFIVTRHSPLESLANLRRERTVVFDDAVLAANERSEAGGL